MTTSFSNQLGIVILAAGSSRRMGRPKLLLPWGDTTVLVHQIQTWRELGVGQICVVCAASDDAIRAELKRLCLSDSEVIPNPEAEHGMFSSIQCAARWPGWRNDLTHRAISLGDQPQLRAETLRKLLDFTSIHPTSVCQPRYAGHLRHPVILPRKNFLELAETSASTLKEFLRNLPGQIAACDVDDAGLGLDIDTPADYEAALARYQKPDQG